MKQKKGKKKETAKRFQGIEKPGLYNGIVWALGLAVIALALLFFESDFLWKAQELNLFQQTGLFFRQQMVVPGGMLTYVGTWLTQFFYYPWMGVLMLIVAVVFGVISLVQKIMGTAQPGFTTVILLLLIIGSFLMISLGIIGYYIARIYDEIKGRPRYIISRICGREGDRK